MGRRVKPEAVVWRRPRVPFESTRHEGVGVPIGQPEFVRDNLERKN